MRQLVLTPPTVEVPAGLPQTFTAERQGQRRCGEIFSPPQMPGRTVFVDAGKEMVVFAFIGIDTQLVVTAIAQSRPDDPPVVFLRTAIQGKHHFRMGGVGIAHAILVLDDLHTGTQRLLHQTRFIGPRPVKAGQPYVAATHGQIS